MAEEGVQRRLAAIVATDMVGYSRLMQADETGTIVRQKAHRTELIDPAIARYRGRIVKSTGDGLLIEYPSVVDAVQCCVEIQRAMAEREAEVPNERRIRYRIGINLGDIVLDGDDILGDGVNVAARLEALAVPGGICVSRTVRNQVRDKLAIAFEDLGSLEVKNMARPIRVFRVLGEGEKPFVPTVSRPRRLRATVGAMAAVLLLFAGAGAWWWQTRPGFERADPARMALALPDKPSIAVLPFANLSGDPAQDYFAAGIAEDIITELAKISGLFVIARNSSFSYKGKDVDVRTIAGELGVKYILEGSVRRVGDMVRINAQLLDADSGGHLWAERYDGTLADVFAVQDRVTEHIVSALAVSMTDAQAGRLARPGTDNLQAYDLALLARDRLSRLNWPDTLEAEALLGRAIEIDPDYVQARVRLGFLYYEKWVVWGLQRDANMALAIKQANRAVEIDEREANAHILLALAYQDLRRFEDASAAVEKAIALEPRGAEAFHMLGRYLYFAGQLEKSIWYLERAHRSDPLSPPSSIAMLASAYVSARHFEDAERIIQRGMERDPNFAAYYAVLAILHASAGEPEEAGRAAAKLLSINPNFTIRAFMRFVPYSNPSDMNRDVEALRAAGLPE